MESLYSPLRKHVPWNKGELTGQKPPLKLSEIWAICARLQMSSNVRELAMFNLAIDSKLRACDFTRLRVQYICHGNQAATRATVLQQKAQRPVQFEITAPTRESVEAWIKARGLKPTDFLFPSRLLSFPHLSTRQYSRLVHRWVASIAPRRHGIQHTHTMRRTKVSLIYRRTKILRTVQLLLGHTKLDYLPRGTMSRRARDGQQDTNRPCAARDIG